MLRSVLVLALLCAACFAEDTQGGIPLAPLPVFDCVPYEVRPNEPAPTNINNLAPHDIDVVMSMGDSITAAFAATATHILEEPFVPREDRYLSYTSGGGSMQYTVNNFLQLYNRNITGSSSGQVLPLDGLSVGGHHITPFMKKVVGLNAALSGAKIQDIPQEISFLETQLKTLYADSVDFENSWKVATLLIGANNLCVACNNNTADTPETFGRLLNQSISQMYTTIPRVRLNLLSIFNVSQVYYWAQSSPYCTKVWTLLEECPCLNMRHPSRVNERLVNEAAVQYRQVTEEVAAYWQSLNLPTFSVTVQPFLDNMKIINGELTSNFDCFHPSKVAHSWFGTALWNSLWEPVGQKPTNVTDILIHGTEFVCPGRDSFMQ